MSNPRRLMGELKESVSCVVLTAQACTRSKTEIWKFPLRDLDHREEVWKYFLRDGYHRTDFGQFYIFCIYYDP